MKYFNLRNPFAVNVLTGTGKVFLFFALLAILNANAFAQVSAADAAAQRARAWGEAINSDNRAAWRKFITENHSKAVLGRFPVEARFNNYARICDETRGLTNQSARPVELRFRLA